MTTCPRCHGTGQLPAAGPGLRPIGDRATYLPTREPCIVIGVANRGQYRPGDPGSGDLLYAVRSANPAKAAARFGTWQASADELR